MNPDEQTPEQAERTYWESVCDWVRATQSRYRGYGRGDLTQCFMRGPFAGWSERQVAELADLFATNATRFPLRGHEGLDWGGAEGAGEIASVGYKEEATLGGASEGVGQADGEAPEDAYCPVCRSCGEEGCCSLEKSILSHGCKYAQHYAQQAYYDKMVIDEFHKLAEEMGLTRDETGNEPKDPIGDLYDRAWRRVEEKHRKA